MGDLKKIWNPIEVFTLRNKLIFIKLENNINNFVIDTVWDKILGDGNIIFEFNPGEAKEYTLIGTTKECVENSDLLDSIIESTPKYEEVWDIPNNDKDGWEKVFFIDNAGKPYKLMNREFKYRKLSGKNYIHYGMPIDVRGDIPLNSAMDSFTTLLRSVGLYQYTDNYIILKHINYVTEIKD